MANTSAWKDCLVVLYYKVYDSTTNAISFLAIESSTLLCRAVIHDLMAGMHVNFDAEKCLEVLFVVCIFPPVFPRFKNRRCKTDGRYDLAAVLRPYLRINTTLVILQALAGCEESTKKCI